MSLTCRAYRPLLGLTLLLLAGVFLAVNRPTVAQTVTEHPYIDPGEIKKETCLGCHADKGEGKFIHSALDSGCESCHQVTSEKEKEKTTVALLATGGELCAMCHEAKKDPVVHGPYKAGQCLVCHNPHSSNFARQTRAVTNTLCLSCHAAGQPDVKVNTETATISLLDGRTLDLVSYERAPKINSERSEKNKSQSVSHPVTGRDPRKPDTELNCVSCHNPHASKAEHLLRKATESPDATENLCLSCHASIAAALASKFQHAGAAGGCGTCHVIHKEGASGEQEFDFHLTKPTPALCSDCHDFADQKLSQAHQNQPFEKSRCTECHNPHGSDRPKLINNFAHPPFAEKQCDTCHNAPRGGKVDVNEGGKRALCYMCHDGIQKQIESSKRQHPAFQMTDTCTVCHSPHSSREPKLMQISQGRACATCHEKSTEPVRHGPYDRGQCTDCHDAHGAEEAKLLRVKGNNLCRACHVPGQAGVKVEASSVTLPWSRTLSLAEYQAAPKIGLDRDGERGHPLVGHPTSGKSVKGQGEITCGSCHRPHSSKLANLILPTVEDDIQLCELCHK